jgi:transcriptional regulator with XRE-family HTH domain
MSLGHKIKLLRTEQKMSQSELAEKCGFSQAFISQIESEERIPSDFGLAQLCVILKVKDKEDLFKSALEFEIGRTINRVKKLEKKQIKELNLYISYLEFKG